MNYCPICKSQNCNCISDSIKLVKIKTNSKMTALKYDIARVTVTDNDEIMAISDYVKKTCIAFVGWIDNSDFVMAYSEEPKFIKDSENISEIRYTSEFVYGKFMDKTL